MKSDITWSPGERIKGTSFVYLQPGDRLKTHGRPFVRVRCIEHNNEFEVSIYSIKNGDTKSCTTNPECVWFGVIWGKRYKDSTLIPVKKGERPGRVIVRCVSHSNEFEISLNSLKDGKTKGCKGNDNCMWHNIIFEEVYPGTSLIPVKKAKIKNRASRIIVRCVSHNNEFEIALTTLKRGSTTSCRDNPNCKWHSIVWGKKYGETELVPVRKGRIPKGGTQKIIVRCSHGNEFETNLWNLKAGLTTSCHLNSDCIWYGIVWGEKFGNSKLTPIRKGRKRRGQKQRVVVHCSHGKEFEVELDPLKRGVVVGCRLRPECIWHGVIFGEIYPGTKLIPIRKGAFKNRKAYVVVRCVSHGNEFETPLILLKNGDSKGCLNNHDCVWHNIVFGVVYPGTNLIPVKKLSGGVIAGQGRRGAKGDAKLLVRCTDHGNEFEIKPNMLVSGNTTSCRANEKCVWWDIEFGRQLKDTELTPIRKGIAKNNKNYVVVQCSCGGPEYEMLLGNFKTGRTLSCGHGLSKGERKIDVILNKMKLDYKRQASFPTCVGLKNGRLRFDRFVPSLNLLIEFQGAGHYGVVNWGGTAPSKAKRCFKLVLSHDRIKKSWAEANGYKLIAVPYWTRDIKSYLQSRMALPKGAFRLPGGWN